MNDENPYYVTQCDLVLPYTHRERLVDAVTDAVDAYNDTADLQLDYPASLDEAITLLGMGYMPNYVAGIDHTMLDYQLYSFDLPCTDLITYVLRDNLDLFISEAALQDSDDNGGPFLYTPGNTNPTSDRADHGIIDQLNQSGAPAQMVFPVAKHSSQLSHADLDKTAPFVVLRERDISDYEEITLVAHKLVVTSDSGHTALHRRAVTDSNSDHIWYQPLLDQHTR